MRISGQSRIDAFFHKHRNARRPLEHWATVVKAARWSKWADVQGTFASADYVKLPGGRNVVVFNVVGGCRLVVGIQYGLGLVNVRFVLTHKEYDRDKWKEKI